MDKIRDIAITEAILHVLDKNADEPVLNDYMMDLNEESYKFILSHIEKVLKDENLKYASFKSKDTAVKEVSQDYLNGLVNLKTVSGEIAKSLFEIMQSNDSIPSCDLLVVSFTTEFGPMVGILKIDYIKQYTHKIDIVDNNIGIGLMSNRTGLSASKKVQKCAFIKPIRADQDYDLLVLDKGTTKESDDEEYGANYFIENFLGCLIKENDRDTTRKFMSAVELWTRSNLKDEAAKAENIRSSIRNRLIVDDNIDIYDIANRMIPSYEPEVKKDFIAYLQALDIEKFVIDKEYVEKKFSKLKIQISSDIELNISDYAYRNSSDFAIQDNGDGSIHMIIKNIQNYVEK